jgi:ketosteroid isomerase-like protein
MPPTHGSDPIAREHEERVERVRRFIEANADAERRRDWTVLRDFYTEDAVYWYDTGAVETRAEGPDEICRLVLVRDQLGWLNWTFPFEGFAVQGDQAFTRWWNRGPGTRPDGSPWQVPGMSHLRFGPDGRFCEQMDLFDLGKLVQLMDEMPEDLLLPVMRERQLPVMRKLVAQAIQNG